MRPQHSKLVFLSEGGGKTRTIAIGDYWTQLSLYTLHKYCMQCLRQLSKTDFTFNHQGGADLLKSLTKEGKYDIFSLDLKSATDRFPAFLQKTLLAEIIGPLAADAWMKVMTNRDFGNGTDVKVRYGCGQPMGLLSSWAVFSLTHHAIIEYCAFKEGLPAFREYIMLGDDVVIYDIRVANRYLKVMSQLGVDISIPKSFISKAEDPNHIAEFAKQIMLNGQNLSPIPIKMLNEVTEDIYMFPDLIKFLRGTS